MALTDMAASFGQNAVAATPWALIGIALVALIKSWPELRRIKSEGDATLVAKLMARVDALELQVSTLQKELKAEQDRHDAEMQVARHQSNNDRQVLDMMLYFLKANVEKFASDPDALRAHITEIEAMREQGRNRIAIEKGAMAGARGKQ